MYVCMYVVGIVNGKSTMRNMNSRGHFPNFLTLKIQPPGFPNGRSKFSIPDAHSRGKRDGQNKRKSRSTAGTDRGREREAHPSRGVEQRSEPIYHVGFMRLDTTGKLQEWWHNLS